MVNLRVLLCNYYQWCCSVPVQAINQAIMREREEEIMEIHQNVTKVNEVRPCLRNIELHVP